MHEGYYSPIALLIAPTVLSTPIFFGHGAADDKIKVSLGKDAHHTMTQPGFDV
jgi:hypothetical protein